LLFVNVGSLLKKAESFRLEYITDCFEAALSPPSFSIRLISGCDEIICRRHISQRHWVV